MANFGPPRTSSRLPAPGIFVNVEFGVSFSNRRQPHTAAMAYTSRRMQERLLRQRQQQEQHVLQERSTYRPYREDRARPHPSNLMPGGVHQEQHQSQQSQYSYDQHHHYQEEYQPRRSSTRSRDSHERTSSAPPSLSDRSDPFSDPVSPMGTISTFAYLQHTSSMPIEGAERAERPLPPLPSRFRLGEDNLPWTTEPWYFDPESEFEAPTMVGIETQDGIGEDPQRVRDLEALHQAMMTVDTMPQDGWEPWQWDSVEEMPRGPRSLGWAVRTDESRSHSGPFAPPPYVVSQWEEAFAPSGSLRPRSSG